MGSNRAAAAHFEELGGNTKWTIWPSFHLKHSMCLKCHQTCFPSSTIPPKTQLECKASPIPFSGETSATKVAICLLLLLLLLLPGPTKSKIHQTAQQAKQMGSPRGPKTYADVSPMMTQVSLDVPHNPLSACLDLRSKTFQIWKCTGAPLSTCNPLPCWSLADPKLRLASFVQVSVLANLLTFMGSPHKVEQVSSKMPEQLLLKI